MATYDRMRENSLVYNCMRRNPSLKFDEESHEVKNTRLSPTDILLNNMNEKAGHGLCREDAEDDDDKELPSRKVMSNQEAYDCIGELDDAQEAAEELIEEALSKESYDDVSCIVVVFH
ncbi:putative protein phosphatase 2C 28 [Prunus yedoensis var. nudiflora]|uniref:Protein-serine/threonine phosphatase n=1 Tax=Prunus yedoensis var. nudiflora TaxID=2094558 RepID=A0A314UIB9_PRUYE|nr:putative protein phosphatase 2C 28 [Prunus yedoensis var. nudiflora]